MKLSLLIVAILGVAAVSAIPTRKSPTRSTRSLSDDWVDFYALIDTDAVLEIVFRYVAEDEEVQSVLTYVQTDDFKALILAIEAIPEYIAFLDYLEAGGLRVYYYVEILHSWLGLGRLTFSTSSLSGSRLGSTRSTGGIAGLWAELKAILPLSELRALFEEKLQTSPDFANLIAHLSSDKAQVVYDALKANEEYQYIRARLVEAGLNLDLFFDWLRALINWA